MKNHEVLGDKGNIQQMSEVLGSFVEINFHIKSLRAGCCSVYLGLPPCSLADDIFHRCRSHKTHELFPVISGS